MSEPAGRRPFYTDLFESFRAWAVDQGARFPEVRSLDLVVHWRFGQGELPSVICIGDPPPPAIAADDLTGMIPKLIDVARSVRARASTSAEDKSQPDSGHL